MNKSVTVSQIIPPGWGLRAKSLAHLRVDFSYSFFNRSFNSARRLYNRFNWCIDDLDGFDDTACGGFVERKLYIAFSLYDFLNRSSRGRKSSINLKLLTVRCLFCPASLLARYSNPQTNSANSSNSRRTGADILSTRTPQAIM